MAPKSIILELNAETFFVMYDPIGETNIGFVTPYRAHMELRNCITTGEAVGQPSNTLLVALPEPSIKWTAVGDLDLIARIREIIISKLVARRVA